MRNMREEVSVLGEGPQGLQIERGDRGSCMGGRDHTLTEVLLSLTGNFVSAAFVTDHHKVVIAKEGSGGRENKKKCRKEEGP